MQNSSHQTFFEGYTTLALLLVLFQAFHGLAVALVYKYAIEFLAIIFSSHSVLLSAHDAMLSRYADAIIKNFANSSVMAILIVISAYFFSLQTTLHSWLGIIIVMTTTYCYMNIAIDMQSQLASKDRPQPENAYLLSDAAETVSNTDPESRA